MEIWKLKTLNLYVIRWNDEMVSTVKYYGDKIKQSIGVIVVENVYEFLFYCLRVHLLM